MRLRDAARHLMQVLLNINLLGALLDSPRFDSNAGCFITLDRNGDIALMRRAHREHLVTI